jgi:hypothetical protein
VAIEKGALHIEKKERNRIRNCCLWYNQEIPGLNTMNDFSITFFASAISFGDIFNAIDFQWGKKNGHINGRSQDSLYQVNFRMKGEITLDLFNKKWYYLHRENFPTNVLIADAPGAQVNPNHESTMQPQAQYTKYEIIQQGDTCIIMINGHEVLRKPIKRIYGNSIGIQQCLKCAWKIDEIIIRQDPPVV